MSKALKTILLALAVVALAGGLFFFGTVVGHNYAFGPMTALGFGSNGSNGYGPRGMAFPLMNGRGGPGMMDGQRGYGMMGGFAGNGALAPLTVEQAKAAAAKYLASLNNTDLEISEVMIFNNNAYVAIKEVSTGNGAFELLVDSTSQVAYPEHGPNMMWNLKYGGLNHQHMMGNGNGMMRGFGANGGTDNWGFQGTDPANAAITMPVSKEQAIKNAQAYLDANIAGAVAANDPTRFYGYYTLDFSRDGKPTGMLSVNGFSGQVFVHVWHGTFIEESQVQ